MTTTPKAEGEAKTATCHNVLSPTMKNSGGTNLVERERYGKSRKGYVDMLEAKVSR